MKRQSGFSMVEMAIVISISMTLTAGVLLTSYYDLRSAMAKRAGIELRSVGDSLKPYMRAARNNIEAGTGWSYTARNGSTVVVANPRAPSVATLVDAGFIPQGFGGQNLPIGGGYTISIEPAPAGCTPNAGECTLVGMIRLTGQIRSAITGRIDGAAIGDILAASGLNAGADIEGSGIIRGANGSWQEANPVPGASGINGPKAGIVAYRVSVGALVSTGSATVDTAPILPQNGTRAMTGNLDMGSNNISNIDNIHVGSGLIPGQITSSGTFSAASVTTGSGQVSGSDIVVTGVTTSPMITAPGGVSLTGALTSGNNATGAGTSTASSLASTGSIIASSTGVNLSDLPSTVSVVNNSTVIPKPACPPGKSPDIFVTPASFAIGDNGGRIGGVRFLLPDFGTFWMLEMQVYDISSNRWVLPGQSSLVDSNWMINPNRYSESIAWIRCL